MKQIFYSFILLFSSLFILAQSAEFDVTERDVFFDRIEFVLTDPSNGETVTVGKTYTSGGWGNEILSLKRFDNQGNIIWANTYPNLTPDEAYFMAGATMASDGSVYITGTQGLCDALIHNDLIHIDANGTVLWQVSDPSPFDWDGPLIPNQNGGCYVRFSNGIIQVDPAGQPIDTIFSTLGYIKDYQIHPSTGDLLTFSYTSPDNLLSVQNSSGSLNSIIANNWYGQVRYGPMNNIYLLDGNTLKKYDNQLNFIDSLNISELTLWQTLMEVDDQYIYVVGKNEITGKEEALTYDLNLNLVHNYEFEQFVNVIGMQVLNGEIITGGSEYQHSFLKKLPAATDETLANQTNNDLSVINILLDTTLVESFPCDPSFDVYSYDVSNVRAVVQNQGDSAVDYFEINTLYSNSCFSICADFQAKHEVYNQVLQPGDIDTFYFGDLNLWNQLDTTRLCLHTTRPNEQMDDNHDNDEICRSFLVNDIVLPINDYRLPVFNIYPNPVRDIINIDFDGNIEFYEFSVIGKDGRQILSSRSIIDVSSLAPGNYILQIQGDGHRLHKPFVKL